MRGWSIFGCGVMQLGLRRDAEDRLETTRWLTLFYLPLVPLSRWRVRYLGMTFVGPKEDPSFNFASIERLAIEPLGAATTAAWGWFLVALALGPALMCVFGIQGAANNFEMALVFASCCWPLMVLTAVFWRWRRLLQPRSWEQDAELQ